MLFINDSTDAETVTLDPVTSADLPEDYRSPTELSAVHEHGLACHIPISDIVAADLQGLGQSQVREDASHACCYACIDSQSHSEGEQPPVSSLGMQPLCINKFKRTRLQRRG